MQKRRVITPDVLTRVSQHVGDRLEIEDPNLQPLDIRTIRPDEASVPGLEYNAKGVCGFIAKTALIDEVGLGDAEIRDLHVLATPREDLQRAA